MQYHVIFRTRMLTAYGNSRLQVIPDVGLVFFGDDDPFIVFWVSSDINKRGFPVFFRAYKIKTYDGGKKTVEIDEKESRNFVFKSLKYEDAYNSNNYTELYWGII